MNNILQNRPHECASLKRIHIRMSLVLCSAVLGVSFLYGLYAGMRSDVAVASAFHQTSEELTLLKLPRGVDFRPMGSRMSINGKKAEMVSFTSEQPLKTIMAAQSEIWKEQGYFTTGVSTSKKGVVIALDRSSNRRYVSTGWLTATGVHGVAAAITLQREGSASIPGLPLPEGAESGSVFSSVDSGVLSHTGVFTLPMNSAEARRYYERSLSSWALERSGDAYLTFRKDRVELVLLLTTSGDEPDKSLLTAIRSEQ